MRRPLLPERVSVLALAALMFGSGTIHLVRPQVYEPLIPKQLGSARLWVLWSGAAEYACGALVLPPRTRRLGGWLTAALFVFVFPGNIKSAIDGGLPVKGPLGSPIVAYLRLPLQIPLVLWALRHARGPEAPPLTVQYLREAAGPARARLSTRLKRAGARHPH